jgi:hypothetical protein
MQHVNHAGSAHAGRIVNTRIRKIIVFAQLLRPLFREVRHVILAAKMQAARRTRLDARRFKSLAHTIRAQRALINALRLAVKLRNIEWAAGDAIAAADAFVLLKIHDAIRVLHDCAVGRACCQASRLRAVHALIFAHQPHQRAIFLLVLVE